jgi:hypothetical protein
MTVLLSHTQLSRRDSLRLPYLSSQSPAWRTAPVFCTSFLVPSLSYRIIFTVLAYTYLLLPCPALACHASPLPRAASPVLPVMTFLRVPHLLQPVKFGRTSTGHRLLSQKNEFTCRYHSLCLRRYQTLPNR